MRSGRSVEPPPPCAAWSANRRSTISSFVRHSSMTTVPTAAARASTASGCRPAHIILSAAASLISARLYLAHRQQHRSFYLASFRPFPSSHGPPSAVYLPTQSNVSDAAGSSATLYLETAPAYEAKPCPATWTVNTVIVYFGTNDIKPFKTSTANRSRVSIRGRPRKNLPHL